MPVYLSYGSIWLKLKETASEPVQQKGRRRKRTATPYGLVAESVERLDLRGLVKVYEVVVPSTKVSRFAARLVKELPHYMTAVIEPYNEDYIARFYAPGRQHEAAARSAVDKLFKELRLQREEAEEEMVEEEGEEDVEEEEE